jgi:FkbM family methyltransferase
MSSMRTIAKRMMPQMLADRIQSLRPNGALEIFARKHLRRSYAQDGEDRIAQNFLGGPGRREGWYVDVGAHHPGHFSNTLLFHLKGWRGINIDAQPGSMDLFKKMRPRDINLEVGISDTKGERIFHVYDAPEVNTFSKDVATSRRAVNGLNLVRTMSVPTLTLAQVFSEHMPAGVGVDLMSVDVEGLDLEVLKSNDWNHWRPSLVLAEDLTVVSLSDLAASAIVQFMRSVGYVPCAKTRLTLFFAEESRLHAGELGPWVGKL